MNARVLALIVCGCLAASAALAGEKHETHIKIVTDDGDDGVFEWHSTDPGADFSDLEVGESRTVTGDDGKEVTVTRNAEGFEFDVDGRTIDLMAFDEKGDVTIDIEKSKNIRVIKTDNAADVTIISADEIDDETRAKLAKVLKDAGKDGEILILDGSELGDDVQAHGEHDIRVIRKKIEKTN